MADLDLARRAVACPGWRWMPGMRDVRSGERYEDGDGPWRVNKLPDLADPATLGCLLALVREAWPSALVCVYPAHGGHRWEVEIEAAGEQQSRSFFGTTEAEALVLALEAAHDR